MSAIKNFLFLLAQFCLPHHLLSRLAGQIADCRWTWVKDPLIKWFINTYQVKMEEAANTNPKSYPNFNDFFTRALAPTARQLVNDAGTLICPVDGSVSQLGIITGGRIYQAKGQHFSTLELLGGDEQIASRFESGKFITLYLSPKDYHRIHMPVAGRLSQNIYIPGRLFSVSPLTTEHVPRLFARNERLVTIFETKVGPMALVLVGAMIVASIETVWGGLVAPPTRRLSKQNYDQPVLLERGAEMGRFKLGSTVVLLFAGNQINWAEDLRPSSTVRMGQLMAHRQATNP